MKNLVLVNGKQEVMTSLQIAEITGKEHKSIMRDIRVIKEQLGNLDGYKFVPTEYLDNSNRKQPMFELDKKSCLLLSSGYDIVIRAKIINRWEELELNKTQFEIPTTLSGALMLAAKQAEQIEAQQLLITEQAPKAEFYDAVVDSKDAIDMAQVAKTLNMGIGRNNLFEFLRDKKVLMERNLPFQKYCDAGWFRCVESKYEKPNGDTCINIKTVVFQKGLDGIRNLLKNR